MSQLNLRAAIPLVVGLLALLVALVALMQMITAERSDARANLEARERIVLEYADNELTAQLYELADRAQQDIDRALANPLLACPGCYYSERGRQLLPRIAQTSRPGQTPVRDAYAALRNSVGTHSAAGHSIDDTWAHRVALHRACGQGRPGAAGAVLEHRAHYVLPVEREMASALALVEDCRPAIGLLPGLLRDGIAPPGGRRSDGLQPMVLRHLHRLGPADAAFIIRRVIDVSVERGIETGDFEQRLTELTRAALALPGRAELTDSPHRQSGLSIVRSGDGHWLVQPSPAGVRGVAVDLGALLNGIAQNMRQRSLLDPDDRIELRIPTAGIVPLHRIGLGIVSSHMSQARIAIGERHVLKLALLALCAGMGVAIAVLALALQRRRRRLLELKSHFIASVSHELRTPLASMRVMVETLARRTDGMPEVRDYPARVLSDIDGMSFLVENILSFNRLARGQWQQRTVAVKLAEVVTSACEEVKEWHSRPVRLRGDVGDAVIQAEPELVRLLFRNLALNAVVYNRRDPVDISVEIRSRPGQELEVLFGDNGVGIAAEQKERVFDEFYRGAASSMARGSGLGLALCRRIMALHNGTIEVADSSSEGTTFRMRFP
ncbi:MAG: HAMP domain-containing histidine kinase [Proteobacteria bacterium]|nr:HAMP domain-containing histidine kinase [Pseudomonadota bacterium]